MTAARTSSSASTTTTREVLSAPERATYARAAPSALGRVASGNTGTAVQSESIAYIEPRDMVVVHDFSRSMNFDSYYSDETGNTLTQPPCAALAA